LNPTELNLLIPSSGLSKCEITDLFGFHSGCSSTPNCFNSVDLPEPLEPTITPILKSFGKLFGYFHGWNVDVPLKRQSNAISLASINSSRSTVDVKGVSSLCSFSITEFIKHFNYKYHVYNQNSSSIKNKIARDVVLQP
jgi:hypothetical protein